MFNKIRLQKVKYLPTELEPGILYVSLKYGVAGHLCPCGCENKIITPLDPTEWHLTIKKGKPSLYPSIGNWQLPCKSHYWITDGEIEWSYKWTQEQILAGRIEENKKRELYYEKLNRRQNNWHLFRSIINWFSKEK
jgi:hypothetical protein